MTRDEILDQITRDFYEPLQNLEDDMTPKLATDYLRGILERAGYRVSGDRLHLLDKILKDCDARLAEEARPRLKWKSFRFYQVEGDDDQLLLGGTFQGVEGFGAYVCSPERRVIGEGYDTRREAASCVEHYWNRLRS